eukprot:m.49425 g.49425  ORF g.49425 m.49425 type:complete len:228 (+) comp16108_c0_seq1:280-963(+)
MALTRTAITFGCLAAAMAETVDWRTKGVVPPVKNQGQMGSPSAFALVDVIGMLHTLGGGQLVDLSIGEAADCCGKQPMADPLACLVKLGGLCTTADYPRPRGTCVRGTCTAAFPLDGWTSKDMTSVQMMKDAVRAGPILAGVDADKMVFQEYAGGVLNSTSCGQEVDHIVSIVGFDDNAAVPYWIVRNSWGAAWGDSGYVLIALGDSNICGINSDAVSVTPKSLSEA